MANGFNAATTRRPWRTSFSRGPRRCVGTLQCGHDPKAVENDATPMQGRQGLMSLQCGHDPKAVENRHAVQ